MTVFVAVFLIYACVILFSIIYYGNAIIIFEDKCSCDAKMPQGYSIVFNQATEKYAVKIDKEGYLFSSLSHDWYDSSYQPLTTFPDSCRAKIMAWSAKNKHEKEKIENNFK
jgi:hypothetical protein